MRFETQLVHYHSQAMSLYYSVYDWPCGNRRVLCLDNGNFSGSSNDVTPQNAAFLLKKFPWENIHAPDAVAVM